MKREGINPVGSAFMAADGTSIFDKFGYSAAVRAGDFVYAAGQIGLNPDGSQPEQDDMQMVNAFDRLKIVLEAAGSSLDEAVELVSYHVHMQRHLQKFVEIKGRYLRAPFPAWTALEVAGLARPGLVIEIKAIAYSPRSNSH
ncbi:RidA family protein [Dyella tabacisoli]|uniref:RidA family protein n=1 Tax=Dyella tabacisoli TaxID=2282381 RepID=A0A369UI12_9GAMM|nr:RidA family protein [Dyella tabacisoli]RDD80211.1 RidA family protein [Dyella tabacisoli]